MSRSVFKEVRIKWLDSAAPDTFNNFTLDEAKELQPVVMWEWGILLGENAAGNAWVVASNYSEYDRFRRVTIIKKKDVLEIKVIGKMSTD